MARIVTGGLTTFNLSTHLDAQTADLYGVADYLKTPGYTGGSWKFGCDSSGNFMVGTAVATNTPVNGLSMINAGSSSQVGFGHANGTAAGVAYAIFAYNGGLIGSITQSGTTAVAFNTTSDRRLKREIAPLQGALDVLRSIKWRQFEFTAEPGRKVDGVIADELQEVYPLAVTGEKDAMERRDICDADGVVTGHEWIIKPQQVDLSKLVPIVGGALQEALALIDDLRARVATLEAAA